MLDKNIKKLTDWKQLLKKSEIVFLLSFEILLIVRMINIYSLIPSIFDTLLFSIVTLIGLIVFLGNIILWIHEKKKPHILLILYILALIVSSLVNGPENLLSNAKVVLWQILYLFVVFNIGEERDGQLFKLFDKILVVFWDILVVVSLVMFFIQFKYIQPLGKFYNGLRVGFVENRLYGIFSDPNFASIISVVVILLLLRNSLTRRTSGFSIKLNVILIIINYIYIVLSGSRTAELALVASTVMGVLFYSYANRPLPIRSLLSSIQSIVYALIAGGAIVVLFAGTQKVVPVVATSIKTYVQIDLNKHDNEKKESVNDDISLERSDVKDKDDVSNNRFKLWQSSFEIFEAAPLFGTSTRNFIPFAQKNVPTTFIASKKQTSHNFIFYLLATSGLFGTIPMVMFIFLIFLLAMKYLFTLPSVDINFLFQFLIALVILVSGMLLTEIVLVNKIGALVFWLSAGYISKPMIARKDEK